MDWQQKKKYLYTTYQNMYKIPLFCPVLFALFILTLYSCTNGNYTPFIENFSKTIPINVKHLEQFSKDSIGNPNDIFSFGQYIILSEPQTDKLLSVNNMNNHIFKKLQTKGRGANELICINQINVANDSTFFVVDPLSQYIVHYQINSDTIKTTYTKLTENISNYFCHYTKEIYTQKGKFKYTIRDTTQHLTQHFGEEYSLPGYSPQIISHLDGFSTVSFYRNRIAWFSCTGDIFEIYDFNEPDNCKLIKREIGIPPLLAKTSTQKHKTPVFLPETKLGVYSITSNDEYIFILYNENHAKDEIIKKEAAYLSNKILVYDWSGNPVEILKLDKQVSAISYSYSNKHFYCLSHNEDAEIIVVHFKI